MNQYTVTILPDNKKVVVDKETTILAACLSAHIYLNSACGGDGVCGKCQVVVKSGAVRSESSGLISPEDRKRGVVLACQAFIESDGVVEIPISSRLDLSALSKEELEQRLRGVFSKAEDIAEVRPTLGEGIFKYLPLVTKFFLELPKPNFDDKLSDLERICRALEERMGGKFVTSALSNIRRLGALLRSSDWKVTVAVAKKTEGFEVISIEPGDRSKNNFGFAFDIGTTTISGQLIDLNQKKILGTKATYNRQATFGSDVISRIIYAGVEGGLEKLHLAVRDVMNEMIEALIEESHVDPNDVTCLVTAGNTTMNHLLLRIDPTYIRQEPYVPTANILPVVKASEAGININPHGLLYCIPGVASYVGGDITAGVVACDMHESKDVNLLIDIGTNGEIVLGNSEWLMACAASAGPAFEGSGMRSGMRAVKGAIQSVKIKEKILDVSWVTIAGAKPRGLCGSGYIDLICELLKTGVLDKNGKINCGVRHDRVRQGKFGYEFVVARAGETETGEDIVITDADLDNLKRAKAAIYAGMAILVRHMGMKIDDLKKIYIAGGFGTALNIESAIRIGLIPDLKRDKFIFVGNSSLAGARQSLLSQSALKVADEVSRNITYFELSTVSQYMDEYMAALFFPHTDFNLFPSVRQVVL